MVAECNADEGHPCDADDGEPCASCKGEHEYWRRLYETTPAAIRGLDMASKEELDQELVDAGRGHLVRP